MEDLLTWLNRVMHGWAGYFQHTRPSAGRRGTPLRPVSRS
ncbi:group II intron maturase-specific domain-containing protein [Frankia sp. Cr2]